MEKRFYTEAEITAKIDRLEEMEGEKMDPRFRRIFILIGKLGLFDAFADVCAEAPDERTPDYAWFKSALDEAQRRVAA